MGLGKYRGRFGVKGLGNLEVREVSPSAGTSYDNLGWLGDEGTEIGDIYDSQIIRDEAGSVSNVLEQGHDVTLATNLQQVGIDELNIVRNASGKVHSLRYSGLVNPDIYQYYCMEQARINPSMSRKYSATKQTLPFRAVALKQDNATFDTPEYYLLETAGKIRTENLQLWISPRHGYNAATSKVLDVSGFARHGDLNSDYATIWQGPGTTPNRFMRYDGVNDECSFGDILDDDGVSDFMIEHWIRIAGADGTFQCTLMKISQLGETSGYGFYRSTNNKIRFALAVPIETNATVLQNVWTHLSVAIDRNGNGQVYINGIADGAAVSVSGVTTQANAIPYSLAKQTGVGTFYNIDIGDVRHYIFGAGGLPSDIATIIANHFAAERGYYGI